MSRMILECVVDLGLTRVDTNSGIGLLISVTDADGNPYTGLQAQNFQIQLMFDSFDAIESQVFQFFEENKLPEFREHVPGIYLLSVNNVANVWSVTTYTAIVKVQERPLGAPRNHGQTMVQFRVPT
jgi:hypothetical protein